MTRKFSLFSTVAIVLAALASPAFASLDWLSVTSATDRGATGAWDGNGGVDLGHFNYAYPGDPFALNGSLFSSAGSGFAMARGTVLAGGIDQYARSDAGDIIASSSADVESRLRRAFRVMGGVGSTSVTIPFDLFGTTYDLSPVVDWSAGVVGLSSLSGYYMGDTTWFDHRNWVGTLNYGQTYEFELVLRSTAQAEGGFADSHISLPGNPVPEPSSLLLISTGFAGFGLIARSRGRRGASRRNRKDA